LNFLRNTFTGRKNPNELSLKENVKLFKAQRGFIDE
jgi:hypothetical protein